MDIHFFFYSFVFGAWGKLHDHTADVNKGWMNEWLHSQHLLVDVGHQEVIFESQTLNQENPSLISVCV